VKRAANRSPKDGREKNGHQSASQAGRCRSSANDDAVLEEIDSSLARPFEPSDDAPIEVSEFHPVESEHTDAQDSEEATDPESDEDASSSRARSLRSIR